MTSINARLFCQNKRENLKNKPKIGNSTEKQAQLRFVGKLNKAQNNQVK